MIEVKVLRLVYIYVHVCNVQKGCVIGLQTVLYNVHVHVHVWNVQKGCVICLQTVLYNVHVHVHVHTCISNIFTAQEWC